MYLGRNLAPRRQYFPTPGAAVRLSNCKSLQKTLTSSTHLCNDDIHTVYEETSLPSGCNDATSGDRTFCRSALEASLPADEFFTTQTRFGGRYASGVTIRVCCHRNQVDTNPLNSYPGEEGKARNLCAIRAYRHSVNIFINWSGFSAIDELLRRVGQRAVGSRLLAARILSYSTCFEKSTLKN
jgi:hypothetical protein